MSRIRTPMKLARAPSKGSVIESVFYRGREWSQGAGADRKEPI